MSARPIPNASRSAPDSPERNPRPRSNRVRRWLGLALTACATAAILALTLSPQPTAEAMAPRKACVICGTAAGSDVLANVLLFAPLGVGLALLGVRWRRALLAGLALSLGIELTQYLAIPGRFASVSDVLTNTTGAALGALLVASWRTWCRPAPRVGIALATMASAVWLAALALASWALSYQATIGRYPPTPIHRAASFAIGMPWFDGEVLRARFDGVTTEHRGTGPVYVKAVPTSPAAAEVVARGRDHRPEQVPLLIVYAPEMRMPWLVLAQRGDGAVVALGTRAWRLRLQTPTVAIDGVLGADAPATEPYLVRGERIGDSVTVTFERGRERLQREIRLWPSLGWALVSPIPRIDAPLAPLASVAWLAGLALPIGYWVRWGARGGWRSELIAAACLLATLLGGLVLIPAAAGFGPARPWEWLAALGGVLAGAGLAEGARRLGAGGVSRASHRP